MRSLVDCTPRTWTKAQHTFSLVGKDCVGSRLDEWKYGASARVYMVEMKCASSVQMMGLVRRSNNGFRLFQAIVKHRRRWHHRNSGPRHAWTQHNQAETLPGPYRSTPSNQW
ncbi:unnamed protein product, partial [Ectocarpus sp. 6 AP-2014]